MHQQLLRSTPHCLNSSFLNVFVCVYVCLAALFFCIFCRSLSFSLSMSVAFSLSLCNTVISYLAMFRLEELGMPRFKRLVSSQHAVKMYKVFCYINTHAHMYAWMWRTNVVDWCVSGNIQGIAFIPNSKNNLFFNKLTLHIYNNFWPSTPCIGLYSCVCAFVCVCVCVYQH